ncbi:MAG: S8 family serine peptidase [Candidatus Heimdallarchaeota archaeon]|nr:S8 family serine peptidase [Candidatus Heimdallarchaeota archaeon]
MKSPFLRYICLINKYKLSQFFALFFALIMVFPTTISIMSSKEKHKEIVFDSKLNIITNSDYRFEDSGNQNEYKTSLYKGDYVVPLTEDDPYDDYKYNQIVYDESLYNYMGLAQIHKDLKTGISGYNQLQGKATGVAIFDLLADYTHDNLHRVRVYEDEFGDIQLDWNSRAISSVVLINDERGGGTIESYEEININSISNPYEASTKYFDNKFTLYDYFHAGTSSEYSHGTNVAGIINQIAPGAEIISIALPSLDENEDTLFNAVMNFLDFLEEKAVYYNIRVVNINMGWQWPGIQMSQGQKDNIENRIFQLVIPDSPSDNGIVFVAAAGNQIYSEGQTNIIYPSHLANNWEDYFNSQYDAVINNKYDYQNNPAIATGFISVSSIHDFDSQIGLRKDDYVYDEDYDAQQQYNGDLKLMGSGVHIRTTSNT